MRGLLLTLLLLPLLTACPHRVKPVRSALYSTHPVCPGVVRKDDHEILRAGFAGDLEQNEIEALQELEQSYLEYVAMAIDYPRADNAAEAARFKSSLGRKHARLEEVVAMYEPYLELPRTELAVMSLYRVGEAYELLAVDIENTRVPAGSTEADLKDFCGGLIEGTRGLREKAVRHFTRCAERAREGGVNNSWSTACQRKSKPLG